MSCHFGCQPQATYLCQHVCTDVHACAHCYMPAVLAQRTGVRSPVFSKTRARAAFAAAALALADGAAHAQSKPRVREYTAAKQSPGGAAKRKAPQCDTPVLPHKRLAPAPAAAAQGDGSGSNGTRTGLPLAAGPCVTPVNPTNLGTPPSSEPHRGVQPAVDWPQPSLAESTGSDPLVQLPSGASGAGLTKLLRFKTGVLSGPGRAHPVYQTPTAASAGDLASSGGTVASSPPGRRAVRCEKENVNSGAAAPPSGRAAAAPWAPQLASAASKAPRAVMAGVSPSTDKIALFQAIGRMGAILGGCTPAPLSARSSRSAACTPRACPPLFCSPPEPAPMHGAAAGAATVRTHAAAASGVAGLGSGSGLEGGRVRAEHGKQLGHAAVASGVASIGSDSGLQDRDVCAKTGLRVGSWLPLADVTLALGNTPPDAVRGSQDADSAATAATAGAWA